MSSLPELSLARRRVWEWAGAAGLDLDAAHDLSAAAYEAMANAVEHPYPHPSGPVTLAAHHHGHEITLEISDEGHWRPAPSDPGWRGRGLQLIQELLGQLDIDPSDHGTTIRIHWPPA